MKNVHLSTTLKLVALTGALLVAACNTMEGAGQDLQAGGRKVERAADQSKGNDSRAVEGNSHY